MVQEQESDIECRLREGQGQSFGAMEELLQDH